MSTIASSTYEPVQAPQRNTAQELILLFPATAAMYSVYQGTQSVLLPQQVAALDPVHKVSVLAMLAIGGTAVAAVVNPLAGLLSDRTHSSLPRRSPWLLASAALAALALVVLSRAHSVLLLGCIYMLVMLLMGCYQAIVTVILPDRIPPHRLGVASAVIGIATSIGILLGVNMVSKVFTAPLPGYCFLGATLVVFAVLFVTLTRDTRNPVKADTTNSAPLAAKTSFFSAFSSRNFTWVFLSRCIVFLAYWAVSTFLLYILQGYVRQDTMPASGAVSALGTLTTVGTLTSLVGIVLCGTLSDRLQRRKLFVFLSAAIAACSLAIPLLTHTWHGILIFEGLFGFAFGSYLAVDTAMIATVLPSKEDYARDFGILNVAMTAPQLVSQFVGAVLISHVGYAGLFFYGVVCSILGAIAILPVKNVR